MSEKPVSTLEPKACISCGAVLGGVFCSNCGEKQIDKKSYSIKNFFYRFISEVANFDGRVYTSFKLLFSRPGLLTHEYISGKRKPYLKPVQMFLIANILYFLIQPFTIYTGLNTTLQSQVKRQFYSDIANLEEIVEKKVEQSGLSYIEYERLFNTKSSIYARSLIFILIPLFAITLAVFFRGRREYFVEHLEFSVHFFAWKLFFLLSIFLFFYGLVLTDILHFARYFFYDVLRISKATPLQAIPDIVIFILSEGITDVFVMIYLYFGIKRFYRQSGFINIGKSFALVILLFVNVLFYRFMLFWITYLTV